MLAGDLEGRKEEIMSFTKRLRTLRFLVLAVLLAGLGSQASAGTRFARVYGGYTDNWPICLSARDATTVLVVGDGDTDLDLYVYDENGYLIDSDTDATDRCIVSWTPRWDGCFMVKVVNRGRVYNAYSLTVE
jgi:hypothetical protein